MVKDNKHFILNVLALFQTDILNTSSAKATFLHKSVTNLMISILV